MKNVIIDTDIGDDADDALALAYAMRCENINLLGVCTVFKNTKARAQMAMHLLKLAGNSHVPVCAGQGDGLTQVNDCAELPCQFQPEMTDYPVAQFDPLAFYASILCASPHPVSIIAIGPLTNIALLLQTKPELVDKIESIVVMGGCYYRHANEWNIVCDPEAADVVFSSNLKVTVVGLDVTTQCRFRGEALATAKLNANTPLQHFLIACCNAWFDKTGYTPILHDPLAIHALSSPDKIVFNPEQVRIELNGTYTRGMTVCTDERLWEADVANPNCSVAASLNYAEFVDTFLRSVFLSDSAKP